MHATSSGLAVSLDACPCCTQIRHVALYYHMDHPTESLETETKTRGALRNTAKALGVTFSVHTFWGLTLYHPDDLPYSAFHTDSKTELSGSSRGSDTIVSASRFSGLPGVMTDFRKAVQSLSEVRPCIPAPASLPPLPPACLPAPHVPTTPSAPASSSHSPPQQAALPQPAPHTPTPVSGQPGASSGPDHASGVSGCDASEGRGCGVERGALPVGVSDLYVAAGAGEPLQRLQRLTRQDFTHLPAPNSGGVDPRSAFKLVGGEASGKRRLKRFIYGYEDGPRSPISHPVCNHPNGAAAAAEDPSPPFQHYTDSRAQAFGEDNSTKLSAFVASGALSPRQIYWEVRAAQAVVPAEQVQWLILHQCIRDFFMYTALKEGCAMMGPNGIQGLPVPWTLDESVVLRWSQGATGLPFVDACMRELAGTGFMSNRGRQNVASLLAKDLKQDWRQGAELFESLLVDCDVAVNYCNWNYFAGIGNDLRNRQFKTVTQGMQYDTDAQLIGAWVPELAGLPTQYQHQPFSLSPGQALQYHYIPGVTYPAPMIDAQGQVGAGPKMKGPAPVLRERKPKKDKERKAQRQ
ncbi:MAG: hypothetical protein WDW38_011000 [Sanguina aurantia]